MMVALGVACAVNAAVVALDRQEEKCWVVGVVVEEVTGGLLGCIWCVWVSDRGNCAWWGRGRVWCLELQRCDRCPVGCWCCGSREVVAWAGQKVVVAAGVVERVVEWWWSAVAARASRSVDQRGVPVRTVSAWCARSRWSFRAWALWCAAHGRRKIGGLCGRGWLIDCRSVGVGMRACTQWSVGRSGLGCLLFADVVLAVEMGVVG